MKCSNLLRPCPVTYFGDSRPLFQGSVSVHVGIVAVLYGLFSGQYASVVDDSDPDVQESGRQDDDICPPDRKYAANGCYTPSDGQHAPRSEEDVQRLQMTFYAGWILCGCTPVPLFSRRLLGGHWFHGCLVMLLFHWQVSPPAERSLIEFGLQNLRIDDGPPQIKLLAEDCLDPPVSFLQVASVCLCIRFRTD